MLERLTYDIHNIINNIRCTLMNMTDSYLSNLSLKNKKTYQIKLFRSLKNFLFTQKKKNNKPWNHGDQLINFQKENAIHNFFIN